MNRNQKIIISIIGITIVLLALLGITYAYYLTRIQGNTNTNSISVSTVNLKLIYSDGNEELDFTNIMPGWINDGLNDNPEPKTFSVTNNGNASVNEYAISIEEVTNTLTRTEDLTYTLKCTQKNSNGVVVGTCNGNSGVYPKTNIMLITNSIEVGYTHEYELIVNYINHETINQSIDMGSTIKGKVQMFILKDTVDVTGIVSNYNENDYIEINSETKTSRIVDNKYTLIGIKPGIHTIKVCSKEDTYCAEPRYEKKLSIEKGNEVQIGEKEVSGTTIPSITITEDTRTINVNIDMRATSLAVGSTTSNYNPFKNNTLAYNIYKNKALVEEYDSDGNSLGTKINKNIKSLSVVTSVSDGTNIEDSGLFMTQDDYGVSYYYRGTVRNNYVNFAGFPWRILRINGDGSVRLIFDGTTSRTYYNGVLRTNLATKSSFNTNYDANKYVGYMYDAGSDDVNSPISKTSASSVIKTSIDNFYKTYLLSYQDFYSDTLFCGDKSIYQGTGIGSATTYYSAYGRKLNKNPTFICKQKNDRYTVDDVFIGNGALTYPIATLTMDELFLAGAYYREANNKYYLYNDLIESERYVATMTPAMYNSSNNHAAFYYSEPTWSLSEGHVIHGERGVRPVINLKYDLIVESGIGTKDNPYTVMLNN